MNNERFKQRMAELEQERDKFVAKLTPESQQEYKQKEEAFNRLGNSTNHDLNSDKPMLPNK